MKKSFLLLICLLLSCTLMACTARETAASTSTSTAQSDTAQETGTAESDPEPTPAPTPLPTDEQAPIKPSLSIACSTKGYNPYLTTDTLVTQTSSLLFEQFITITPDFDISYRLAQSVVCTDTSVTITLRTGCSFADGSLITPNDALHSLQAAMASESYRQRFANVRSVTATETELILTLGTPDSLFAYLLDIPILKADECGIPAPTASGRYTYGADGSTLCKNPFAPSASDGPDIIQLVSLASYDEMMSALALGQTNYTVQGEGGTNSSISTTEHYYKTNALLFLGVNAFAHNPLCNTAEGRRLLSALTDRDALSTGTYLARTYAARGAINPLYPCANDAQTILSTSDDSTLDATMQSLGYHYDKASGFYQKEDGTTAKISILVHSSSTSKTRLAQEISEKWTKYGIESSIITASDFNSFLTLLESNEFELYIGELKLYNNIELSSFWGGSAKHGIAPSEALLSSYAAFRADAANTAAFESAFAAEMPYIPLLWKNGVVLTRRNATGVSASVSDQFYSFGDLTFPN